VSLFATPDATMRLARLGLSQSNFGIVHLARYNAFLQPDQAFLSSFNHVGYDSKQ
jgi:hypothetical protein